MLCCLSKIPPASNGTYLDSPQPPEIFAIWHCCCGISTQYLKWTCQSSILMSIRYLYGNEIPDSNCVTRATINILLSFHTKRHPEESNLQSSTILSTNLSFQSLSPGLELRVLLELLPWWPFSISEYFLQISLLKRLSSVINFWINTCNPLN